MTEFRTRASGAKEDHVHTHVLHRICRRMGGRHEGKRRRVSCHSVNASCHWASVFVRIKGCVRLVVCVVLKAVKAMVVAPPWVDETGGPKVVRMMDKGHRSASQCFEQDRLVLDRVCRWFMHRSQRGLFSCRVFLVMGCLFDCFACLNRCED